nr:RHS repeat-associated core domain-containing protein [Pseudomonas shirazica]
MHEELLHADSSSPALRSIGLLNHTYDPYGVDHRIDDFVVAFNGELRNRLSASYLLGNGRRMYSPALRRFHSADRQSPFSQGGINGYAYCLGDPVNRVDPSGEVSYAKVLANTVWVGKRAKASMSKLKGLKRLDNANKYLKKASVAMATMGLPGANWVNAASFSVKLGVSAIDVGGFFGRMVSEYFIKQKVMPIIVEILPPKGLSLGVKAPPAIQASQVREGRLSRRRTI